MFQIGLRSAEMNMLQYYTVKDRLHSLTLDNTLTVPNIYIIYNFQIYIIYVIK